MSNELQQVFPQGDVDVKTDQTWRVAGGRRWRSPDVAAPTPVHCLSCAGRSQHLIGRVRALVEEPGRLHNPFEVSDMDEMKRNMWRERRDQPEAEVYMEARGEEG
jgi:hypothetical protein